MGNNVRKNSFFTYFKLFIALAIKKKMSYLVGSGLLLVAGAFCFSKYLCGGPKKQKKLVALVDPQVNYQFELVFNKELTHDTRLLSNLSFLFLNK